MATKRLADVDTSSFASATESIVITEQDGLIRKINIMGVIDRISTLEDLVTTLTGQIATLQSSVNTNTESIGTLENTVSQQAEALDSLGNVSSLDYEVVSTWE